MKKNKKNMLHGVCIKKKNYFCNPKRQRHGTTCERGCQQGNVH